MLNRGPTLLAAARLGTGRRNYYRQGLPAASRRKSACAPGAPAIAPPNYTMVLGSEEGEGLSISRR